MSKTIVFVHGAWVTPDCWNNFKSFFEANGFDCLAPAWPYLNKPMAELKQKINPRLSDQTISNLVDHYAEIIRSLPEPPVLIGHSFGGLIVQLLLDRDLGKVGVAIDAGPPRGVLPSWSAIKSASPVLLSWLGWTKLHTMSFNNFCKTFANGLPISDMQKAYDEQIVQAPGRIYFQAAFGIGNGVNFKKQNRVPLLLIAGQNDLTSTPSMVQAMYKKYRKSPAVVDSMAFEGRSHWLIAEPGWEEVAGGILTWLKKTTEKMHA